MADPYARLPPQSLGALLEPQVPGFEPPQLPKFSMESMGPGQPQYGLGASMPLGGGSVEVEGRFLPQRGGPAEIGARVGYKRAF
jgi:hypothetical protein